MERAQRQRRLRSLCVLLLALTVVGTVVAIGAEWPAQFGGRGDPNDVPSEFLTRGTALSPPLAPMILFAVGTALLVRRDRWGVVGLVLTTLLSAVFVIGSVGEAASAPSPDVPTGILLAGGIVGGVLSLTVVVSGILALAKRWTGAEDAS